MQGCVCVVGNDVGDVLLMPLDQLLLRFDNSDDISFIVIMILLLLSGIVCVGAVSYTHLTLPTRR